MQVPIVVYAQERAEKTQPVLPATCAVHKGPTRGLTLDFSSLRGGNILTEQNNGQLKGLLEKIAFAIYNLYFLGFDIIIIRGHYSKLLFVVLAILHVLSWGAFVSKKLTERQKAFNLVAFVLMASALIFIFTAQPSWFLFYFTAVAVICIIYQDEKILCIPAFYEIACIIVGFVKGGVFDVDGSYAVAEIGALVFQTFGVNCIIYFGLLYSRNLHSQINMAMEESCRIPKEYLVPEPRRYQVYDLTQQIAQSCMGLRGRRPQYYIIDVDPNLPRRLIGDINRMVRAINNIIYFEMANQPEGTAIISFTFSKEHPNGGSLIISARFLQRAYGEDEYAHLDSILRHVRDGELKMLSQVGMEVSMAAAVVHLMNGSVSLNTRLDGVEYILTIPQIYQDNRPLLDAHYERTLFYINQNRVQNIEILRAFNNCVDNLDRHLDSDMVFCYTMHDFKNWLLKREFKYIVIMSEDYIEKQEYFSSLEGRYELFIIKNSYEISLVEGRYRHLVDKPAVLTNIFVELSEFLLHKNLSWSSQAAVDAAYEAVVPGSKNFEETLPDQFAVARNRAATQAIEPDMEPIQPIIVNEEPVPSPMLDTSVGLVYCGGKESLYHGVLKEYAQRGRSNFAEAEAAFAAEDWSQYTIFVHGIKSSTLSIGAAELSDLAKQLEFAGKENNIEFIKQNHARLIEMYSGLVADLQNFFDITPVVDEPEEDSCEGLRPLSGTEAKQLLEDLEQVAYTFDSGTMIQLIEGMAGYSYAGKSLRSLQDDMLRKIEKEDFLSALSLAQDVLY